MADTQATKQKGLWSIIDPNGQQYPVSRGETERAIEALMQQMNPASKPSSGSVGAPRWQQAPIVDTAAIEVEAPDGTIVEFPAGTDDATISRVMREEYDRGTFAAAQHAQAASQEQGQRQVKLDQIEAALRKADAAGNTADAKRLADAYRELRDGPQQGTAKWMDAPIVDDAPQSHGIIANAGAGTQRGISDILGMPVDAVAGAINGASGLINGAFGTEIPTIQNPVGGSESIYQALSPLHSQVAAPQTSGERIARRIGQDAAAAAIPGVGIAAGTGKAIIPALAGNLVSGAGAGAAGGAAQEATDSPLANLLATFAGGMAGPAAVNVGVRGIGRAISPNGGASPDRLAMAQILEGQGVQTTAGQRVGSDALRRMESGTGAGQARLSLQDEQFTQAALRTLGTNARRATPEVMEETYRNIGREFDDILDGVGLIPDAGMSMRTQAAVDAYRDLAPATEAAPLIGNVAERIVNAAQQGQSIPGHTAKAWRSQLSRALRSNSEATRTAAGDLMEVLDDATGQALSAMGRPDDMQRLTLARQKYRDFLALERAMSGAGEDAAMGIVSPARLRSAISNQGIRAYSQGRRGEMGDLARAGAAVLGRPSTSGTAENLAATLRAGLGIVGTGVAGMSGAGVSAFAYGMALAGAPFAVNRLALTSPVQGYLANQLVTPRGALPQLNEGQYAPALNAGINALAPAEPK